MKKKDGWEIIPSEGVKLFFFDLDVARRFGNAASALLCRSSTAFLPEEVVSY